jgi:hypothetical protein
MRGLCLEGKNPKAMEAGEGRDPEEGGGEHKQRLCQPLVAADEERSIVSHSLIFVIVSARSVNLSCVGTICRSWRNLGRFAS